MTLVVDRIEEEFAVCQDIETFEISTYPKSRMPEGIAEGDVLHLCDGEFKIDYEQTEYRKKAALELMEKLFR